MGPTWGLPLSCRSQMGPMLTPWTLLWGLLSASHCLHQCWLISPAHICVAGLVSIKGGYDDLNVLIWINILHYHNLYQCGEIVCVRRTLPHYCNTFSISSTILINMIEPKLGHYFMWDGITIPYLNILRPRQNGRHSADDIFKCIFLNENYRVSKNNSLKYVPWGLINNMRALVQIMAWRRIGDKPLSEAMLVCFTDAYMRHSASMS